MNRKNAFASRSVWRSVASYLAAAAFASCCMSTQAQACPVISSYITDEPRPWMPDGTSLFLANPPQGGWIEPISEHAEIGDKTSFVISIDSVVADHSDDGLSERAVGRTFAVVDMPWNCVTLAESPSARYVVGRVVINDGNMQFDLVMGNYRDASVELPENERVEVERTPRNGH